MEELTENELRAESYADRCVEGTTAIPCLKCRKITMAKKNFYKHREGYFDPLCKKCLTMHCKLTDPDSYTWIFKRFDVPFLPWIFDKCMEKAYSKKPTRTDGVMVSIGNYLGEMKLSQNQSYRWADSERLCNKHDEACSGFSEGNEDFNLIKEAYERGEVSEEQWKTFETMQGDVAETVGKRKTEAILEAISQKAAGLGRPARGSSSSAAGGAPFDPMDAFAADITQPAFVEVDIPDVSEDLTEEDKLYLAMKWGQLYTAADWVWLEQKYNDFMNSFVIQGAARLDTLIMICKTSLKMNQALDAGDIDSYQKLSKVYDSMMKAAKFTEAQRKEEQNTSLSAFGQIVAFCEKEGGAIPRIDLTINRDVVDGDLQDMKSYTASLIREDPAIWKMIEQYIKKREIAESLDEVEQDDFELSDSDYSDYLKSIESQQEEDAENELTINS